MNTYATEVGDNGAASRPQHEESHLSPGPGRVWWHSPVLMPAVVIPLSLSLTAFIGNTTFVDEWRTVKVITPATILGFMCVGLMVAVGAAFTVGHSGDDDTEGRWGLFNARQLTLLRLASSLFFWLTITGYAAFVVAGYRAGVSLTDLSDYFGDASSGVIRDTVGTVTGITTMTQFGIASVVVSTVLIVNGWRRWEIAKLGVVILLAVPRALFFTERLALVEVIVPALVVITAWLARTRRRQRLVSWLPAVLIPALLGLFALFEYTRSWTFYSQHYEGGFTRFALERFGGYYATAYNNGYILTAFADRPGRWPYRTIAFLWEAPGLKTLDFASLVNGFSPASDYKMAVEQHGNWEFNNPSGIASAVVDYGMVGGAIYLLLAGAVAGWLYRCFSRSEPIGVLLYPVIFLGLLELPRYIFWSEGRATPALFCLAVLGVMLRRRQKEPSARPATPRPDLAVRYG